MLDPSPCNPRGQGATRGTALPLGISKQDWLLAAVGRTTSQAQSYGAHQDLGDPIPCLPDASPSSSAVGHGGRMPPPLGPQ